MRVKGIVEDLRTYLRDAPPVLGESVKIRPIDARGRDRLGMRPEERAKRQSEMMKARWARNRGDVVKGDREGQTSQLERK